jgi:hypothetical protein
LLNQLAIGVLADADIVAIGLSPPRAREAAGKWAWHARRHIQPQGEFHLIST